MSAISQKAAVRILNWLHVAEADLVGSSVLTFNGEAGTCTGIRLDDHHGLCFTTSEKPFQVFRDGLPPVMWYPVSTIREIKSC